MSRAVTVTYDVADDRRRRALARGLARGGALWLQGSTWVPEPGAAPMEPLVRSGAALLGAHDRLWAYEVRAACARQARWSPPASSPYGSRDRLVVINGGAVCRAE